MKTDFEKILKKRHLEILDWDLRAITNMGTDSENILKIDLEFLD